MRISTNVQQQTVPHSRTGNAECTVDRAVWYEGRRGHHGPLSGDKLVTVVGHQFITLTVYVCVQHGRHEASHRVGLSAAAETIFNIRCYSLYNLLIYKTESVCFSVSYARPQF